MHLLSTAPATNSFSFATPGLPAATMTMTVLASGSAGRITTFKTGLAPGAASVGIALPDVPRLSLPVNGATTVDTSSIFSWSQITGGLYVLILAPTGTTVGPTMITITSATSASIPNLGTLGLALPHGATYVWYVEAVTPVPSVDAAASPGVILPAFSRTQRLPTTDISILTTAQWQFTTAP